MAEVEETPEKADKRFAAERRAQHIASLEEEKVGYERAGKSDRVAQVEAELKRLGKKSGEQVTRATVKKR